MKNSISYIIPTVGRQSLERTLGSIELQPEDEVLVVGDGMQPDAGLICRDRPQVRYTEAGPFRNWGHGQRNFAMSIAKGSHLAFIDDDDIYMPGYRALFDEVATNCLTIFRMLWRKKYLWATPILKMGNVGTPMVVVPNIPTRLGRWGNRYEGDFDFFASCNFQKIVWRTDIIVICNPE
jgi:hypothetical protein